MYKFQSFYYINRTTNVLRRFMNENEIPVNYRTKIVEINLDVTYNANGYIDKKSERLVATTLVCEQLKAPVIAYFKVSFRDEENDKDDSDDDRDSYDSDSFDSDAGWNETAEPLEEETVKLVDSETDEEEVEEEAEEDGEEEEEEETEEDGEEEEESEEEFSESADDGVVIPEDEATDDNLSLY